MYIWGASLYGNILLLARGDLGEKRCGPAPVGLPPADSRGSGDWAWLRDCVCINETESGGVGDARPVLIGRGWGLVGASVAMLGHVFLSQHHG